jgi:hypothetical protein
MTERSGPKGRTGAAARRTRTAAKPAKTAPRRRTRPSADGSAEAPAGQPAEPGSIEALLATARATASPAVAKVAHDYCPRAARDDAEWAVVGPHVELAALVIPNIGVRARRRTGQVAWLHVRARLAARSEMRPSVLWQPELVEQTIAQVLPKHFSASSLTTVASDLRRVLRHLAPAALPMPAVKHTRPKPTEPFTTEDLTYYLQWADSQTETRLAEQIDALIWLGVGVGARERDLGALRGTDFRLTEHALLVCLSGRWVPAHHSCEQALIEIAHRAGKGYVFDYRGKEIAGHLLRRASGKWRGRRKFVPPTLTRLRSTWFALLLGSGADLRSIMRATGNRTDFGFAHLADVLQPLDDEQYARAMRGSDTQLPSPGELLLPGLPYAAPQVPLRTEAA